MTIHKIFTIEESSSRYGHSAIKNNDKQAYIFDGCNIGKKNKRNLNDLNKMEYKNINRLIFQKDSKYKNFNFH